MRLNLRLRAAFRKQRFQIGELNASIEDSLLGQRVVKAFAAEEQEKDKFEVGNQAFQTIKKKTYHAMAAFNTSTRLFDGLMYLVVIVAGGLFLVYDVLGLNHKNAYRHSFATSVVIPLIVTIVATTVCVIMGV